MLFNSLEFFIFLPISFLVYYLLKGKVAAQNTWLLVCSYYFYASWDYRFLLLIVISTGVDYYAGRKIEESRSQKTKKLFLLLSVVTNLGILGFFKYYNFFIDSFIEMLSTWGVSWNTRTLNVILPVGISFYTFQTLSYTIDIYKGHIKPTKNLLAFATFVSFFPQLVAGPIERAAHLLPQFLKQRQIQYASIKLGLQYTLWGLFKKVVIADNLAPYVDEVFAQQEMYGGLTNIIAIIFFAFQIYCDFSGYTNIAIGVSKMFGFDLMRNFNSPYFAASLREFWQRWHISLSTWFRDYVYIPLGGNRVGKVRWFTNVMIVFTVSGLWHGAAWTFVIWGAIHGIFYFSEAAFFGKVKTKHKFFTLLSILFTFIITCFAWVFFRAESYDHALIFLERMGSLDYQTVIKPYKFFIGLGGILALLSLEIMKGQQFFQKLYLRNTSARWLFYYALIIAIVLFGNTNNQEFIYFQF